MTKLGAYIGNSAKSVLQFEDWLGRNVDYLQVHTGRANWSDYETSISWAGSQVSQLNKPIYWTIPMFANGGSLSAAAAGSYKEYWVEAAKNILATRSSDSQIVVRFGEEFNGGWMPWAAKGNEQAYIQAYRGMVDAFRSVSDKFAFDWNVNVGNQGMNPAKAYPGDAYVDYITMDIYYNTAWDPKDPNAAFDSMLKRDYGLNWLDSFAKAHGKLIAIPEWGVMSDKAGPYIAKFATWMETHNVAYQSYWNSNADFAGALSTGTKPNAAAAYIDAFGDTHDTGNIAPVGKTDAYSVQENATLTLTKLLGVLANDTDANGDALTAMLVDGPAHGKLTLNTNGSLIYTPDTNYSGTDSFTYVPRDGKGAGNVTKVSLTVTESHDAPASAAPVNWVVGTNGSDTLVGDARNNSLNGGGGQDTMKGGLGDDTYVVDRPKDVVIEYANEGIDTVESWAPTYTLSAHVENLKLLGTGQTGIGNELANGITGGAGNDILNGKGGNDWLTGAAGADTFVFEIGSGHDVVRDFATSGTQQDVVKLSGYDFASFAQVRAALTQVGADTLLTLSDEGSVTFLNHKISDFTARHFGFSTSGPNSPTSPEQPVAYPTQPASSGTSETWTMGTNSNDTLLGDSRNNVLKGGGGQDIMKGGLGDDIYEVDDAGDSVVELAGEGIDTVESWVSYTLSANVENLKLLGTNLTGTGNGLANLLVGGKGNDILNGKAGNDYLTGGAGADTFVFERGTGHDVITDFVTSGATHDVVDLTSFSYANFREVRAALTQEGSDTLLSLADGSQVTFLNHKVGDFHANDFLI
ncbi:Ig-like domain-containing protein [Methylobacterium flocculans]|uniref:Ig-like domain-containing protein n=1 Tax=Methylobacterium flocculans TaxID=2984843 RepID=UPI0021F30A4A|nr:Ig-like domain-containing protein [Methylobacterium sp. FF17]